MATFSTKYLGDLRTEAIHELSGKIIITDAPPDNQGKGEAFSPTDLLCSSLTSCMMTLMGISARGHNIDLSGMRAETFKTMASNPRRVSKIQVLLKMPSGIQNANHRIILEKAALTCPVYLSLHPEIEKEIIFNYSE